MIAKKMVGVVSGAHEVSVLDDFKVINVLIHKNGSHEEVDGCAHSNHNAIAAETRLIKIYLHRRAYADKIVINSLTGGVAWYNKTIHFLTKVINASKHIINTSRIH